MFERFTDRARRVVVLAQEEARGLSHDYIGTEHLLLGLLGEQEGVAAQALGSLGVDADGVRRAVEERIGRGEEPARGHIPFTPRAKKVLEFSLRVALRFGHNYIGTEHVLLGLVEEGEGVAAQILMAEVEGGLSRVRDEVDSRMLLTGQATTKEAMTRIREGLRPSSPQREATPDEVLKRLEAIEARLSAIERLLRGREEDAS